MSSTDADKGHHRFCYGRGDLHDTVLLYSKLSGRTGVEMEALTGVNVALLTIYDMCKAMDRGMEMGEIHLEEKMGGKSGHFQRTEYYEKYNKK